MCCRAPRTTSRTWPRSSRRSWNEATPTAPRTARSSSGSLAGLRMARWRTSTRRSSGSGSGSRPTSTARTTCATSRSGRAPARASPAGRPRSAKGRPGWHIECSAMSMRYLGPSFDIHTGGIDLVFPHHEDEIAQSEAATGQPFVRTWLHCAHLQMGGEKMAKRTGNLAPTGRALRATAGHPGRSATPCWPPTTGPRWSSATSPWPPPRPRSSGCPRCSPRSTSTRWTQPTTRRSLPRWSEAAAAFEAAMDDDLAVSPALGALFDLVRDLNRRIDERTLSTADASGPRPHCATSTGCWRSWRRTRRPAATRRPRRSRRCWTSASRHARPRTGPLRRVAGGAGGAGHRGRGHPRRAAVETDGADRWPDLTTRDTTATAPDGGPGA